VALGSDPAVAAALIVAIAEHVGIAAELVRRPLFGVALALPERADPLEIARAIDAEQVTAGFLDLQGRACVALPADPSHVEQTAHCVAKVIHLLLEIHTEFINEQSDACPLPDMASVDAETAATALLDAVGAFGAALTDWRRAREKRDDLRGMVDEGIVLLREFLDTIDEKSSPQDHHAG
jgi:hypothetical protein